MTTNARDHSAIHGRPHATFRFQNPLSVLRSTKFRSHRSKMDEAGNLNSEAIGGAELKSFQKIDPEKNFETLKEAVNGKPDGKKQEITGPTGTVRGFKNLIRDRMKNFDQKNGLAALSEEETSVEEDNIVFYSTSMGGIRSTIEECRTIRKIFHNLRLKVDERDIFMQKEYQVELDIRLEIEGAPVPQVFINGVWVGGMKEILELNEIGELKKLLSKFEKLNGSSVCSMCGGFHFINCTACKGSKASRKTRLGAREMSVLKCTVCNENGLQRCPMCSQGNSAQH